MCAVCCALCSVRCSLLFVGLCLLMVVLSDVWP